MAHSYHQHGLSDYYWVSGGVTYAAEGGDLGEGDHEHDLGNAELGHGRQGLLREEAQPGGGRESV